MGEKNVPSAEKPDLRRPTFLEELTDVMGLHLNN